LFDAAITWLLALRPTRLLVRLVPLELPGWLASQGSQGLLR
jgi:hypothetical protein